MNDYDYDYDYEYEYDYDYDNEYEYEYDYDYDYDYDCLFHSLTSGSSGRVRCRIQSNNGVSSRFPN